MTICDECAWSQTKEKLPYCEAHPDPNSCDKFFQKDGKKASENMQLEDEEVCQTCKNVKDVGLICWWCGTP
jgi:hypothetical protein